MRYIYGLTTLIVGRWIFLNGLGKSLATLDIMIGAKQAVKLHFPQTILTAITNASAAANEKE